MKKMFLFIAVAVVGFSACADTTLEQWLASKEKSAKKKGLVFDEAAKQKQIRRFKQRDTNGDNIIDQAESDAYKAKRAAKQNAQ